MLSIHPETEPATIEFEQVFHRYRRRAALSDISLSVGPGQFVYLVGPSASGKTTLPKLVIGQERPSSGRVWVDGLRPGGRSNHQVRRRVGVIFQDYRPLDGRTALENVAYAIRVANLTMHPDEVRRRSLTALAECGIADRAQAFPNQLSGGQQQRLAIARALAARPRILLADEPTASLDDANAGNIVTLLRRIAKRGTTVVLATHDRRLVAAGGSRVIELAHGELAADSLAGDECALA